MKNIKSRIAKAVFGVVAFLAGFVCCDLIHANSNIKYLNKQVDELKQERKEATIAQHIEDVERERDAFFAEHPR